MRPGSNKPQATAIIRGAGTTRGINGIVKFYQKKDCILVVANIKGLPSSAKGFFGFHIHQGDNCGGVGFSGSGAHFDTKNSPHPMHAGDLPPLILCGKMAHLSFLTDRFRISEIIGHTVIIHNMPDDFTTQPSGNAGEKIACGVIRKE